jgi:TATA-box binding protein (TBP) (component of TFIID and TFIIIB)
LIPVLKIVNLIATADLKQSINLNKLVDSNGFLYDQAIYHCAYLKDERTVGKISIFATGKMISVGTRDFDNAKHDLAYAAKRIADLHLVLHKPIVAKLRNVVATADMDKRVDFTRLAKELPDLMYEPEQFPAAIYFAKELKGASVLIYSNGKVVFAGLRNPAMLKSAREVLENLIRF